MRIRNFCILAHIDHGKSTLADRFLELTGTVDKRKMRPQYLDMMPLEREKGITIKMQPVRMQYKGYILNLIDTPGHVDFSYEVSRSLAAVEGAVLLVDAVKGIQAQTLGNLRLANEHKLTIIPVINKIDLPQARIEATEKEISGWLKVKPAEIIKISAKEGANVEQILERIIADISPPRECGGLMSTGLRALIFDSKYDPYQGVLAFVRVFDGEIKKDQEIYLMQTGVKAKIKEVGIFNPEPRPVEKLTSGEIGYVATGIKESGRVRVGDTIASALASRETTPLPGYQEPRPKVFVSLFPAQADDYELLRSGLGKLKLNDPALIFQPEAKGVLGRGFRCGFLGLLHAEVVTERLKREFNLELLLSSPSVVYQDSRELWIELKILSPASYLGQILELLKNIESRPVRTNYLGPEKVELIYETPLREIVVKNFYDKLKSVSQGFASMDYKILDWRPVDLVKLDILILGRKEEALSRIVPRKEALKEGRRIVEKLKEFLPPQLFSVPLQAAADGRIIARETLKPRRKDVTAPLYGGDYTRKRKLLEKQKKGKKKLKEKGKVKIPPRVFLQLFKV